MGEVGQWLRETREGKGISLAEVEEVTRIRQKFLAALEADDYAALPGEVYVRGFLRNYATFLGLNPDEVLARYLGRPLPSPAGRVDRPLEYQPVDVPLHEVKAWNWRPVLLVLVILLLSATVGYGYWRYGERLPSLLAYSLPPLPFPPVFNASPTMTATTTLKPTYTSTPPVTATMVAAMSTPTLTASSPALSPTLVLEASPSPTLTAVPPTATPTEKPTPSPTSTPAGAITIGLRIVQRSWVRVDIDDQDNVFSGLLEAGEEQTWTGERRVVLHLGNAGGVQLTVNGEDQGLAGEPDEVVHLEWVIEEGEVSGATPVAPILTIPATGTPTPTP